MVTWPCVGSIQQESFNRKKSALQNGNSCTGLPLLFVLDTKIFVTLIHKWRRNKLLDSCPFHPHFYLYPRSSGDAVSYVAFLLIFHRMLSEPYGLDGKSITLNIHIMGNDVLKVWASQTLQNSGRMARLFWSDVGGISSAHQQLVWVVTGWIVVWDKAFWKLSMCSCIYSWAQLASVLVVPSNLWTDV